MTKIIYIRKIKEACIILCYVTFFEIYVSTIRVMLCGVQSVFVWNIY